jgi:hypothetical protein
MRMFSSAKARFWRRSCADRARRTGTPWRARDRRRGSPVTSRRRSRSRRGDGLEPGDGAQQGGLAAARGADEDDELAVGDRQIDAVRTSDLAVGLGDGCPSADQLRPSRSYFIPVLAMPVVMKRCRKTKTSATGRSVTTVIASRSATARLQLALEGVEADLQRVESSRGQHDQRPEELVPAPHDREDGQHRQRRQRPAA